MRVLLLLVALLFTAGNALLLALAASDHKIGSMAVSAVGLAFAVLCMVQAWHYLIRRQ